MLVVLDTDVRNLLVLKTIPVCHLRGSLNRLRLAPARHSAFGPFRPDTCRGRRFDDWVWHDHETFSYEPRA
jgi:hypothetical protein